MNETARKGESAGRGPGPKKILFFFLRFLGFSILLYTAWSFVEKFYAIAVAYGAMPLVALTGDSLDVGRALTVIEEISLNPVVYFTLVAAVPGIPWKERIKPAAVGVLILTAANILTVFLMFLSASTGSENLWTGTEFVNLTVNFFLPILLWVLLAPKGGLLPVNPSNG